MSELKRKAGHHWRGPRRLRWVRTAWLLVAAMSESPWTFRSCISLRVTWQNFPLIPSALTHASVCGGSFMLRNDRLWGPSGKASFFFFRLWKVPCSVTKYCVFTTSQPPCPNWASWLGLAHRSAVIPVRDKVREHDVTVIFEKAAGRFQNLTMQPRHYLCHISFAWITGLTNASFFPTGQRGPREDWGNRCWCAEWQVLSSALSCSHCLKPSPGFTVTPKSHLSS